MKKVIIALCFFSTVFICGFTQNHIELKIATVAPARSPWDIKLRQLAQEWNKITNGEVSMKFFDMVVLGGEKVGIQRMRSARKGQRPQIDGSILSLVGLNELAPAARIFTLSAPFLIQTQEELDMVLENYGKSFEDEIQKSGCHLLTWSNVGWFSFYTKEPYSNLNELKKLKIICSNDTQDLTNVLKVSGFNVEPVPPAKYQQALKTSSNIKGFSAVHLLTYATGLYKDVSYVLNVKMCPVMAGFVMSEESWALIPEKYKPEMLAALERMRKDLNDALEEMDKDCLNKMTAAGLKLISLTPDEVAEWTREFNKAAVVVSDALPTILNMDVYNKAADMLKKHRGK